MKENKPYKQNKVFDNVSETEEFNVYTKIDDLPLDENPAYLEEGINGICTGGSALFNVLVINDGLFPMIWLLFFLSSWLLSQRLAMTFQ